MAAEKYLYEAWYVVAWSDEIGRTPFTRTMLEKPILLFRKENGDAVAIGDRCAHRFAPLSMGKLYGDTVQCPYHGLRYDSGGKCVLNPHADGMIPARMAVPSYPLVERHAMIWLWMGDPQKADPATIPDYSCHVDPTLGFVGGVIEMKANYQLIADNLLDLAHGEFVHEGILASEAITRSKLETIEKGTTIYANRWMPEGPAIPAHGMIYDAYVPGEMVDQWAYMRWDAPAHLLLDVGITKVGAPRSDGVWIYGTDILTPKDEFNTYYFWGITRSYKVDKPEAGEQWRQIIKAAFEGQDQIVIEAQQRMMGTRSLEEMRPVMFASDVAAQRARKSLAKMIAVQAVPAPQNPSLAAQRERGAVSRVPVMPVV